jgi:transcriptional regulator with XRE-family HTH domain
VMLTKSSRALLLGMNEDEIYARFGSLVRAYRTELGMSQSKLATSVSLSRASIANIEAGKQKILLHHLYKFSEALNISPLKLLQHDLNEIEKSSNIDVKLPDELTDKERLDAMRAVKVAVTKGVRTNKS